jgi:hypothetical protein
MGRMQRMLKVSLFLGMLFSTDYAQAGVTVSPYVSISSTKSVKPNTKAGTESEKITQRKLVGVQAGVSFWRLFSLRLSVGQGVTTTTQKVSEVKDEYDEIDYKKDASVATDSPDNQLKIVETQRRAGLSVMVDPGFWIFILRAKAGVQATQRLVHVEEQGKDPVDLAPPPKFKPIAGAGAGIQITPSMKAMMEYNLFFYKFPETEPFEREVAVSYTFTL